MLEIRFYYYYYYLLRTEYAHLHLVVRVETRERLKLLGAAEQHKVCFLDPSPLCGC